MTIFVKKKVQNRVFLFKKIAKNNAQTYSFLFVHYASFPLFMRFIALFI